MAAVGEAPEANNAGRDVERVTISEAATLLNVHPNTVRNRVKAEIYRAEKVVTERGPTWMIDRDSLTTSTPPNDSQQLVGRVPAEALTMLAREIVRESGLQRDPQTEARRDGLKTYVDALKHFGTLSGAAAVGVAALHKSLDLAVVGTVVSLVTLGLSFVIALAGVVFLTSFLADWDRFVSQKSVRFGYWVTLASGVLFFAGVLGFILNAWAWDLR